MKRLTLVLCLSGLLCGCAQQYVIKLSNGMQLTTANKPKLKGATYYFKDAAGHENTIPQGRVTEIEPASEATQEANFKPSYPKPKTHWWQFWR